MTTTWNVRAGERLACRNNNDLRISDLAYVHVWSNLDNRSEEFVATDRRLTDGQLACEPGKSRIRIGAGTVTRVNGINCSVEMFEVD